ncbi:hypothetical protein LZ554_002076 [Drepanopeziza brunnea f. sp. 'monogermtubi']|nr:hypothetical protein LZ554_002076 [Drepanopeziza brunnea f. sp. 'monogermtubi']
MVQLFWTSPLTETDFVQSTSSHEIQAFESDNEDTDDTEDVVINEIISPNIRTFPFSPASPATAFLKFPEYPFELREKIRSFALRSDEVLILDSVKVSLIDFHPATGPRTRDLVPRYSTQKSSLFAVNKESRIQALTFLRRFEGRAWFNPSSDLVLIARFSYRLISSNINHNGCILARNQVARVGIDHREYKAGVACGWAEFRYMDVEELVIVLGMHGGLRVRGGCAVEISEPKGLPHEHIEVQEYGSALVDLTWEALGEVAMNEVARWIGGSTSSSDSALFDSPGLEQWPEASALASKSNPALSPVGPKKFTFGEVSATREMARKAHCNF